MMRITFRMAKLRPIEQFPDLSDSVTLEPEEEHMLDADLPPGRFKAAPGAEVSSCERQMGRGAVFRCNDRVRGPRQVRKTVSPLADDMIEVSPAHRAGHAADTKIKRIGENHFGQVESLEVPDFFENHA